MRYSAFISYNHRDRKVAGWLHRGLETYRVPRRLRGRKSPLGVLESRLPPVFRDREELATSSDLARSVRDALEQAGALIVICSPNGARSRWVNEEIRAFTALGRRDRLLCLIVDGVSHAATIPGADPSLECLPPALFEGGFGEPMAADIRPGADSRRDALLKILAGVLDVGFDELRQREQARRQQRLAVAAAVLGAGLLVTSGLAVTAAIERDEALRQRDIARRKTMTAERTVAFVKSLFEVADPSEARGQTITAREILDRGARRINQGLGDEPSVRAELGTTLGEVYAGLGLYHTGEDLVRKSLALANVDVSTRTRAFLALADAQSRQSQYPEAIASYRTALRLAEDRRSPRTDLVAPILAGLSEAQSELGDDSASDRAGRAALALDTRTLGAESPEVARDLETLATNDVAGGRMDLGRERLERALQIRLREQGASHPRSAEDLNSLGAIAYLQKQPAVAEAYYRKALASYRVVLGDDHPEVATTENNLALLEVERRDFRDAAPLLEHAISVIVRQRNATFDDLAFEYENLGRARRGLGENAEAEALFLKALEVARLHHHRNLAPILVDLADMACARGDAPAGLARLDEARPQMAKDYPDTPWRVAWVDVVRAGCLSAAGRRDQARALLATSQPLVMARWGHDSIYGARTLQLAGAANAKS